MTGRSEPNQVRVPITVELFYIPRRFTPEADRCPFATFRCDDDGRCEPSLGPCMAFAYADVHGRAERSERRPLCRTEADLMITVSPFQEK